MVPSRCVVPVVRPPQDCRSSLSLIYLDHNATTPIAPEVLEALLRLATRGPRKPTSGRLCAQWLRRSPPCAREEGRETASG